VKEESKLKKFWAGQISEAKKREEKWRSEGDKVVKIYRDGYDGTSFNILWANTEILKAATFSRLAPPNVSRRYKDDNPAAREASEILERALEFQADDEDFMRNLRKSRDDMLLPGRGTIWYEYDADFSLLPMDKIEQPPQVDEAGELIESEAIFAVNGIASKPDTIKDDTGYMEVQTAQRITPKYVYWKDYLQSDSRSEEDVWWKARKHGLSVSEVTALLGEEAAKKIDMERSENDEKTDVLEIWEIWSKPNRKRIWFSDRATDALQVEEVPLQLTTFFPCPKPLFPFETTNTMVPIPEYKVYQNQAIELNVIVTRLSKLTKQLKVAGVYNGADAEAVVDLNGLADGQYKSIQNAAAFQERGGFSSALFSIPLQETITTIQGLEQRKQIIKSEIYEITGISDVIRGDTQKYDTAQAQRLKGSYGSLRLRPRREPMEEFIRDGYRIMAEIIADKFTPSTIQKMTGIETDEETMALLRDNASREYMIDVETDSTVQPNEEIDMRKANEYLMAMGSFMQQAIPAAQSSPALAPVMMEMVKFASRQFKVGRPLENAIKEATVTIMQQKPPEQDNGEAQKAQIEQMKVQADMQQTQMDNQTDLQIAQMNNEAKVMDTQMRAQGEAERNQTILAKNVLDVKAAQ